jgi:dipeptidyl aminopeptidase/acylaminoacyl peptidase
MPKFRVCLSVLCIIAFVCTASESQEKEPFSYLDVFDLEYVSDPQISPDGNTIVYVRNQFDIMTDRRYSNLWTIGFDGSEHRAITSGKNNYGNPRWSPDGTRLAYVSGEEGPAQIFIRWTDTGQTTSITNLTDTPGNLAWSPDGKRIAFTKRVPAEKPSIAKLPPRPEDAEWSPPWKVIDHLIYKRDGAGFVDPGNTHIFIISAEGGAPRQLTAGNYDHDAPVWTPDGSALIFSANRGEDPYRDPNNTHIFEVSVETGELRQITGGRGPHNSPQISPDGRRIAYTGFEDTFTGYQVTRLFVIDRDGSNKREVTTDLDRDVGQVEWSPDGRGLFFQYDDQGNTRLAHTDLNGRVTNIAGNIGGVSFGRPYGGGSYSIAKNGRFVMTLTSPYHPADLAVGRYPGGTDTRRITSLNENLFKARSLGNVEEIWYASSHDGKEIHGWIVYPPDFDSSKKYSLILEIHGGPYANYGPRFSPELQLMATHGYVVLYTNPRGSTSYGAEFASWIDHNYPSEDYDDLMSGVDYVVSRGFINEDELFITGGSGGGVLTSWSIGKTDRFAAAVVAKPVINWYSFVLTADMYPFFTKYWFTEMPWDDPEQYLRRSPISLVGNVTTPTMVLTGEEDYRTPMSESEQYYQALQLRGVESVLVRVPGAAHFIAARPGNLIGKVAHIVGWFDKYRSTQQLSVEP